MTRKAEPRELARLADRLELAGAGVAGASLKFLNVIHDQIVALRLHGEVAVDDFRFEELFLYGARLELLEYGPRHLLDGFIVLRLAQRLFLEAPLPEEERVGVDVREDLLQRDTCDLAPTPERRQRDGVVRLHIALGRQILDRLRLDCLCRQLIAMQLALPLLLLQDFRLAGDYSIHRAQALEGIFAVEQVSSIQVAEVFDGVVARERRPTEKHRPLHPLRVHLLEVFLHDADALDEQAGHADGVGLVLARRPHDVIHRLLDAEVVNGVAVVRQDDVYEVLPNVVDVALDGGEDDLALSLAFDFFHELLEMADRGFHRLGTLQDERELHLPRAE